MCPAQVYLDNLDASHASIGYFDRSADDAAARLDKELRQGKITLAESSNGAGYLPALLDYFHINPDTQALVFSKSSFQAAKISPRNPRAIYFNDEVAVGYVRGSDGMEIAAVDPVRGVLFYAFDLSKDGKPRVSRQEACLHCHQGPSTLGVPGDFRGLGLSQCRRQARTLWSDHHRSSQRLR